MNHSNEDRIFTRRTTLKGAGALLLAPALTNFSLINAAIANAPANGFTRRHGLSSFGELALPKDFDAFEYVNPDAPKGGTMSTTPSTAAFNQTFATFNTLNGLIQEGDAPPMIHSYLFASLMTQNFNEADALYGYLAQWVDVSEDEQTYRFKVRDNATFADATPITADDVIFSFETYIKDSHISLKTLLEKVVSLKSLENNVAEIVLDASASRSAKLAVATLPIISKAFYTANEFTKATMDPPLASGPYTVGEVKTGRSISYKRRKNWWGDTVSALRGRYNFENIRIELFRDSTVAQEAFKAQEFLVREEFSSKVWAQSYDFPARLRGDVVQNLLPDSTPSGAQGWFINLRKPKFQDARVRQAIGMTFDFEWANDKLFFGQYSRTHSMFQNSPMMANGPASAEERALLEPYLDQLPAGILDAPYTPPKSDRSGRDRTIRRKAQSLMQAAGWNIEDGVARNSEGEAFTISLPSASPAFERIVLPWKENLSRIGIELQFRVVDPAQAAELEDNFDFDLYGRRYSFGLTVDDTIKQFWGSDFADQNGSRNLAGVKNPALDALTDKLAGIKSRNEMNFICRAIDRIWRANHYWVPQWYSGSHRVAYWDVFGRPSEKSLYNRDIIDTWWTDADKAAKLLAP